MTLTMRWKKVFTENYRKSGEWKFSKVEQGEER